MGLVHGACSDGLSPEHRTAGRGVGLGVGGLRPQLSCVLDHLGQTEAEVDPYTLCHTCDPQATARGVAVARTSQVEHDPTPTM